VLSRSVHLLLADTRSCKCANVTTRLNAKSIELNAEGANDGVCAGMRVDVAD
jgi:hypothetical protein